MAKKLKITEGQLQKLMERKHMYVDNSPEGEVEEHSTGAESAIVKPEEGDMEEGRYGERSDGGKFNKFILKDVLKLIVTAKGGSGLAEQFEEIFDGETEGHNPNAVKMIIDVLHETMGDGGIFSEPAEDVIHGIINSLENVDSNEEDEEEEDEAMNESVKAITANFRRFL